MKTNSKPAVEKFDFVCHLGPALARSGVCLALGLAVVKADVPDLAPLRVSWTGTPAAGQDLAVQMTLTNSGGADATGGWYNEWALSTNATLAGAVPGGAFEYYTFGYSWEIVPAGGSIVVNGNYSTLAVPPGSYYLIGVADDRSNLVESSYANNTLAVPITVGVPDLAPVEVGWTGAPTAGQTLAVHMTITNSGSGNANTAWYNEWVLSTNTTVAGAVSGGTLEYYTFGYSWEIVPEGGSIVVNGSYTMPSAPGGLYYLIGVADDRSSLVESSYANNALAVPITLGVPDLAPVEVGWTGTPTAGQTLAVHMTITNSGSGDAKTAWYNEWVLSTNATVAGAVAGGTWEYYTFGYSWEIVPAGGSIVVHGNYTMPTVPAGLYYLVGVVDDRSNLFESTYANNTLITPITLGVPDLAPGAVGWTGKPAAGQNLAVQMTITNSGSGNASTAWYNEWVLSTNTTVAGAVAGGTLEYYTFGYSWEVVPEGGSIVVNGNYTLPSVAPGFYYLIGVVNDQGNLFESSYTNNALAVPIAVGLPDLAPVEVRWTGAPVAGQNLAVQMTITNSGSGNADTAWYNEWVLSTNA
ncbi:MAG TPA: hypothetical protein VHB20_08865, partial [Verrucomicrobiae bacterium]|nr:hypothetical protein [Verrucomicrobiae bacterium]